MNNEKGSITIVFLFAMLLFLVMTALVVDVGHVVLEKYRLKDALDAAALAGAQDLTINPLAAKNVAEEYALKNGLNNPEVEIGYSADNIKVSAERTVPYFFAKSFGYNQTNIQGSSMAEIKPIFSGSGFVPIGVVQQNFIYGELFTLKYSSSDSSNGNFGALALSSSGALEYKNNLMYGCNQTLSIGMEVKTETGNMSGPTKDGIKYRLDLESTNELDDNYQTVTRDSKRIIYVPIIDSLDLNGRDYVTIVGFAAFYLENYYGNGNESFIEGRFIKTIFQGESNGTNNTSFGLSVIRLVN